MPDPTAPEPLIDPDCRDGKHGSCVGDPCECDCHTHRPFLDPGEPDDSPFCDACGEHFPCEVIRELSDDRASVDDLLGADPDWIGGQDVDDYIREARRDPTAPERHDPPAENPCGIERDYGSGIIHVCEWAAGRCTGTHSCGCGLVWTATAPPADGDQRALFDELDKTYKAASAALAADDMQAWAEHAGRGAEIHEELARRNGWRDGGHDAR